MDILVNNDGVIQVGPAPSMELADFEKMMDIMFWGIIYASLAAATVLGRRGGAELRETR